MNSAANFILTLFSTVCAGLTLLTRLAILTAVILSPVALGGLFCHYLTHFHP